MWSTKSISDRKVNEIIQIQYHIESTNNNMTNINVENVFVNTGDDNKIYHWAVLPQMYEDHLKIVFYRLQLLSHCAETKLDHDLAQTIRCNLNYLNNVLDAMWIEASKAVNAKLMSSDWRSEVFDMWLSIEGRVGRHDPKSVSAFTRKNGLEELSADPFEIGTLYDYFAFKYLN